MNEWKLENENDMVLTIDHLYCAKGKPYDQIKMKKNLLMIFVYVHKFSI